MPDQIAGPDDGSTDRRPRAGGRRTPRTIRRGSTSAYMVAVTVCALALAITAGAEASDGDWTATWSNGHQIASPDREFSLKFGGRIQADTTFVSEDPALAGLTEGDGFEFRRARLFFEGTIYRRIEFKAQYDFAGGGADFNDLWIGINGLGPGRLQFGHFKEPFSLEAMTSSKYLPFVERSLPVEAFAPSRNSGVGYAGGDDLLSYGIGAFYDADEVGTSVDEDDVDVTGRVAFRPILEQGGARLLHLGLSATRKERVSPLRFRTRPEAHFSGRLVDTGAFPADGAILVGGELAGVLGRFWFTGEYIVADADAPAVGDPSFDGASVSAGWYLTGETRRFKTGAGVFDRLKPSRSFGADGGGAWEIAVRVSTIDLSDAEVAGGEQDDLTIALNWYLNPATRMMLDWVHADVDPLGEADFVVLRWQVDF